MLVEQGDQPVQEFTSPHKVSYLIPLIAKTIAETPMASSKVLCQILKPYGRAYCFTDAIIQGARTEAQKLKETMKNLDKNILAEEADGILPADRNDFVLQWRKKHESKIYEQLGTSADQLHLKFPNGIFFAPSFAQPTVPHKQKVFMADACHLNFRKYTLFSCYGVAAKSNTSPVAFAIIFGNKSTSTWRQFWKYALELHPSLDAGDITIITDQDKGQKNAIDHYLKSIGHFHFSYH